MKRTKVGIYLILIEIIFLFTAMPYSYGHGLTAETLPALKIGENEVALFAQFIPNPQVEGKQIGIELFETETKIPTAATTYYVKVIKNNELIFEATFPRNYMGVIIDLIPTNSSETSLEETEKVSDLEAKVGIKNKVKVTSPIFKENGLYLFEVKILTMDSFENKLQDPITYNFGLSYPDVKYLDFYDENIGNQEGRIISYYDQIDNFFYEPETHVINFRMPFEWSEYNINQTTVVHEEIAFPKEFSSLMNANFSAYVNDIKLDENNLYIDDYSEKNRILHLIINQNDLLHLASKQKQNENKIEFSLKPINLLQTNSNEILIPAWIRSNALWWSDDLISDEDFINGIQYLIDNKIMKVSGQLKKDQASSLFIPNWIKDNAEWWATGQVSDDDFLNGMRWLIENGILRV